MYHIKTTQLKLQVLLNLRNFVSNSDKYTDFYLKRVHKRPINHKECPVFKLSLFIALDFWFKSPYGLGWGGHQIYQWVMTDGSFEKLLQVKPFMNQMVKWFLPHHTELLYMTQIPTQDVTHTHTDTHTCTHMLSHTHAHTQTHTNTHTHSLSHNNENLCAVQKQCAKFSSSVSVFEIILAVLASQLRWRHHHCVMLYTLGLSIVNVHWCRNSDGF